MPLKALGEAAAALIEPGMLVGLGTGSSANAFIDALAERGIPIRWVATSRASARRAAKLGIRGGISLRAARREGRTPIDIAIDGADAIALGTLDLIKGAGGAANVEKQVARRAKRFVVIAAADKLAPTLGEAVRNRVPVDVEPRRLAAVEQRIIQLGGRQARRPAKRGDDPLYKTDAGHYILDCLFPVDTDWRALDAALRGIKGVKATGLFLDMAHEVLIAHPDGRIERLLPTGR
jgi:ribose 5-phosphate isomerase A